MSNERVRLTFASLEGLDLMVERFRVRQSISGLWEVSLLVACGHDDLPLEQLLDRGVAFEIFDKGHVRRFTGICAGATHLAAKASARPDALGHYELWVVSELYRLSLRKNTRVFQETTLPNIAIQLLADWGHKVLPDEEDEEAQGDENVILLLDPDDEERFPKRELCVQYEETDAQFLFRILEEAGVALYADFVNDEIVDEEGEPTQAQGHALTRIVLDAEPHTKEVRPMPYLGTVPDAPFGSPQRFAANAVFGRSVLPNAATVRDHDFREVLGAGSSLTSRHPAGGGDAHYEQFTYLPGRLQSFTETAVGDEWNESIPAALDRLTAVRAPEELTRFETNALDVAPGDLISFDDMVPEALTALGIAPQRHPRDELGPKRKHLVVAVDIEGERIGPWFSRCVAVNGMRPYRPVLRAKKPRIDGVQSAIVVGSGDTAPLEQVSEDPIHDRIRIQFHWDRQHKYGKPIDGPEGENLVPPGSCWARWASPMAGSGMGFQAVPRPGHEVLVAFLDGDPDRPIVLRTLHNGPNPPPYSPVAQTTITGLRSNSTTGGGGFNELYFDDRTGAERIHQQAERDMSSVVKATESHSVGTTRQTSIGATDVLHVGDKWELVVGQTGVGIIATPTGIRIQVGGAGGSAIDIGGSSIMVNTKHNIHFHAGRNLDFSALCGPVHIDGEIVDINPPTRKPDDVHLPKYPGAQAPAPGSRFGGTTQATGGGGMPLPPAEMMEDVELGEEETKAPSGPPPVAAALDGMDGASLAGASTLLASAGQLPKLVRPIAELAAPPNALPTHMQEEPNSCVLASAKMLIEAQTGKSIPESALRAACAADALCDYKTDLGTRIGYVPDILRAHGASVTSAQYLAGGDPEAGLAAMGKAIAATGSPAMARLTDGVSGHAIVVDNVFSQGNTQWVDVRDPLRGAIRMSGEQFLYDYMGDGGSGGGSVRFSGIAILPEARPPQ